MSNFDDIFKGQPSDPIEFLYRENLITVTSIGSIFTFALIAKFRETIFDQFMGYLLPIESFEFMKVELPDVYSPMIPSMDPDNPIDFVENPPNVIHFGAFIREAIIWIFMILLLYILGVFVRWPGGAGITFNTIRPTSPIK